MTPALPFRPGRRDLLAAAGLFLAAAGLYAPAVGYPFVNYDDGGYVSENPAVLGGLTASGVGWAATTFHAANWHPLTWLSLQFDATVWGANPAGYHLTNVLLHAANTALVFLALRGLTGAFGRSVVVAALWGAHPLHVESVAWVTERKDVLSMFFGLLAVLAYLRFVAAPGRGRMTLVAALLALGLMAKPMLVTLPFALMLFDYWPLGRLRTLDDLPPRVREKRSLLVLVAVSCVMTFLAQTFGGAVRSLHEVSPADRVAEVAIGYQTYLEKTVYPVRLALFYPRREETPPVAEQLTAVALVAGVTVVALLLRRRAGYLLVGWLWFLGTLVPVIGLVSVGDQACADRYVYLPHVGLFLAAVWAAADLAALIRVPRVVCWLAAAVVVGWLAVATRGQLDCWSDSRKLWGRVLEVDPTVGFGWLSLGGAHAEAGDEDAALKCYERALALDPYNQYALIRQAGILYRRGQWK